MSWLKSLTTMLSVVLFVGCGVKGDPIPPEKEVELGRGKPTYRSATKNIPIEKASGASERNKDDDDERE